MQSEAPGFGVEGEESDPRRELQIPAPALQPLQARNRALQGRQPQSGFRPVAAISSFGRSWMRTSANPAFLR
jgi:hypothetical protein